LWPEAELSNRAGICSGSASAAKEPGQTILVPGHRDFFFSGRPQNTKAANAAEIVSLSNKTKRSAVRYGKIFIFCSHYYQSKAICRARARAVDLPARSFDLVCPGVAPPLGI